MKSHSVTRNLYCVEISLFLVNRIILLRQNSRKELQNWQRCKINTHYEKYKHNQLVIKLLLSAPNFIFVNMWHRTKLQPKNMQVQCSSSRKRYTPYKEGKTERKEQICASTTKMNWGSCDTFCNIVPTGLQTCANCYLIYLLHHAVGYHTDLSAECKLR